MKKLFSLFLLCLSVHAYAQKDTLKLTANINGLTKGSITIQQFLDAKEITVADTGWVVTTYTISAYARNMDAFVKQIDSNQIPSEIKQALAKFPSGTKIYFEYIRAADAHGNKFLVPALGFTLRK